MTMRAYLPMLIAMSLLGNAASLHIDHQRDPVNDEEHMRMIAGVPVFTYNIQDQKEQLRFIVMFGGDSGRDSIETACNNDEHCSQFDTGALSFATFHCSIDELREILPNFPNVTSVEEDILHYAMDADQDFSKYLLDETASEGAATWGLNAINKDTAPANGSAVHVYVYDTGVRTTHAQFQGRAIPTLDAVTGELIKCSCQNTSCAADRHGHGTHCAGTVAGKDYGVAPNARIHAVKVLSDSGSGYTSWQILCHNWIAANADKPAVVSMSLGGSGNSQASKNAIEAVIAAGIPVVVAAGNSNADACGYSPAFIPSAITVGSTTSTNAMSYFSNYGTCLDIWAPGSTVLSCGISSDSATATKSGTSMACPHVAGGVAILFDLHPTITPSKIMDQLLAGASTGIVTGMPGSPASPDEFLQVNTLTVPR